MREKKYITMMSFGVAVDLELWVSYKPAERETDISPGRNAEIDYVVWSNGENIDTLLTEDESDRIAAVFDAGFDDEREYLEYKKRKRERWLRDNKVK